MGSLWCSWREKAEWYVHKAICAADKTSSIPTSLLEATTVARRGPTGSVRRLSASAS